MRFLNGVDLFPSPFMGPRLYPLGYKHSRFLCLLKSKTFNQKHTQEKLTFFHNELLSLYNTKRKKEVLIWLIK
jgi:hypothetical protein